MLKIILLSFLGIVIVLFLAAICFWFFTNRRAKSVNAAESGSYDVSDPLYDDAGSDKEVCDNGTPIHKQHSPDETTIREDYSTAKKTTSLASNMGGAVWSGDKRIVEPSSSSVGWGLLAVTALGASGVRSKRNRNDERSKNGRRGTGWSSGGEELMLGGGDIGGFDEGDGGGDGGCGGGDGGGGE